MRAVAIVVVLSFFSLLFMAIRGNSQVVVPSGSNKAIAWLCNKQKYPVEVRRYSQEKFEVIEKNLAPGQCVEDQALVDAGSKSPFYLLLSPEGMSLVEGTAPLGSSYDWEKVLFLFLGALLAPLTRLSENVFQPLIGYFRTRSKILGLEQKLIWKLRKPQLESELESEIKALLEVSLGDVFVTRGLLSKIDRIQYVYLRAKAKEIDHQTAIGELGGKP